MIFASDLDNTLIYSYKRNIGLDKVVVELKGDKEMSFMSFYSHRLLKEIIKKVDFIPITTRSVEQYKRIEFLQNYCPNFAIVANGGILLKDGKIEKKWYEESLEMIGTTLDEIDRGIELLLTDENIYFEVRKVDGLFGFSKSKKVEETVKNLKSELNLEKVSIYRQGEKVYIFPKVINKGTSLKRLKKILQRNLKLDKIICAGDSEMDVSMLELADISIFPEKLSRSIRSKNKKYSIDNEKLNSENLNEGKLFSDEILKIVEKSLAEA